MTVLPGSTQQGEVLHVAAPDLENVGVLGYCLDQVGLHDLGNDRQASFLARFLKQMQAWFAEHMPSVRTVLKPISSVYTRDDPATWEEIQAKGDAAIIGVGH